MIEMGRPKSTFPDLPPRMTGRRLKSGKVLFYYTGNGKKEPLGSDYGKALHLYADHETCPSGAGRTFREIAEEWERDAIHVGRRGRPRKESTQAEYRRSLAELHKGFDSAKLEQIRPLHVRQYLDRRTRKVLANREFSILSIIFNWARGKGYTDAANPCLGIDKNYEAPRTRYVHDAEFKAVWDASPYWLQDLMDLMHLTYQRPSDVLSRRVSDLSDGYLWFAQSKTGRRLGFCVEGELKAVLERIQGRERKVSSLYLIADERGQPVQQKRAGAAFRKARGTADWQLRDLRAKAVTDTDDIREASKRAGHESEKITRKVYDRTRGVKVRPLR